MNGDMNGTMEEPMEMAPNSLTRAESNSKKPVTGSGNKPAEPIAASISSGDCCDKSSTPENNGVEQDPDNKQSVNISDGNTNANGESSQESDNDLQKTNDHDIKVPTEQSSNNLPQENQSNNSSDSNNETTLSSQDKQDKTKISQGEKSIESNHCKLDTVENEKSNDESEVESLKNHNNSSDSNAESTRTQDEQESSDKSLSEKTKDIKEKLLENDAEIELSEDDYEDESSEEDGVIVPGRQKIEDTVSINSDSESEDDETSRESQNQIDEVVILDNDTPEKRNGTRGSHTPEVHEIVSDNDDDCVVTEETTVENGSRRSSRNLKRKCYASSENGEESDIEEVLVEDPLNETKSKNSVKTKRSKLNKKKPSLLIVDTDTILSGKSTVPSKSTSTGANTQSLYQSIAARGTTVTPIVAKPPPAPVAPPPPILPSLTDDMFVVEAPSFIVPYVYEKPSTEPFRKFVDALGKEIEEKKAEEEKERLEKAKEEKEKKEKEKQERRDRGEEVVDSEPEVDEKATEKKARRRRKNPEDDDRSWDGSKEDSDESLSDVESIEEKEDSVAKTTAPTPVKTDSYFECSLGKFFINIGLNLVTEYVQNDLLKLQNRKLNREKKSGQKTKATATAIASLTKNLEFSKENNAPYAFTMTKCEFCTFKTESALVMKHHLETPHMKNNLYTCNFCEFEIKSPHEILTHMETKHNVRGRLERALSYHQCANCPFEDNGKGKLARHLVACAKKYKAEVNLAPPFEWEPPAKIPKITRPRNNNSVSGYQTAFNRAAMGTHLTRPIAVQNLMPSYRPRCRLPATAANSPRASMPPAMRPNLVRQNSPSGVVANNAAQLQGKSATKTSGPSLSITPLPRAPLPAAAAPTTKGTFVICEICDGYIKDLEQLRNHMQWIHKVKIHPKMIYNRPPLNCQKCQFRFFTDQGLERHLLGSHGLVTSSMQEAANKGRDAGRCPVCGRVYQSWLLKHVARDHNLTLKPAHLSYKCTVCTATFGMYKQFEHHVYSAHRVVAKRVMDKSKAAPVPKPAPAAADAKPRPVKISNEITVTPQPAKASTSAKGK